MGKKRLAYLVVVIGLVWLIGFSCTVSAEGLAGANAKAGQDAAPARVIAMAPSITEVVFALGRADYLVGVSEFCTYPPEARALPKVGGFFNPNLERIAALKPDLVIVQGIQEKVDAFCRAKGIRILHVDMDSLATIYEGILAIGAALDRSDSAGKACNAIREELEAVRRQVAGRARKRVFVCLGRAVGSMGSLYTAGGRSFISEILGIAGGENIFSDVLMQPYPEASKESLIKRAPEIIIDLRPGEQVSDAERERIVAEWDVFHSIPAVSDGHVYVLTQEYLLLPGPRVALATRRLAETLHPEVYLGP